MADLEGTQVFVIVVLYTSIPASVARLLVGWFLEHFSLLVGWLSAFAFRPVFVWLWVLVPDTST